ncbi:hypothetical protein C0991_006739 [Blastosporella zonata]|nr:hypothetical protein C0991_006739 [Blastosporella zonata]
MKPLPTILFSLTLATSALAHGFVSRITIDGNVYKGDIPNGELNPSIIRLIDTTSPVKGTSNPDINCGSGTPKPAQLVGNAMPGDLMTFTWDDGDGGNWPHNTGPLITYMASCGSTTCDQFDSTTAKWFKIDQQGQKSDGSGNWNQGDVSEYPRAVRIIATPSNYIVQ